MKRQAYNSALAYAFSLMLGGISTTQAAPGTLAQQPLFLQVSVPPNIFFLNDNSGSMGWELLTNDYGDQGLLSTSSDDLEPALIHHHGCGSTAAVYDSILQTRSNAACDTVAEEEWRARFHEYNHLYYDPSRTYRPWTGTDSDGDSFDDASITAAKLNPNNPNSPTIDLTMESAVLLDGERDYYSSDNWSDWCSDRNIALSDCSGWRYYVRDDNDNLVIQWVRALSDTEKTNFANWFSYHRTREYTAKYAISLALQETGQARVGYGTINNSSNNSIRIAASSNEHKHNVLAKLFSTSSSGGTPLRTNLMAAGNYYETGTLFGSDGDSPILGSDDGGACQSNNAILMTDGFYNGSSPNIGNVDGDNGVPFADTYSNTLADVAMYYYERDLAPNLPNDYPASAVDPATHQHMNTYTISFGMPGEIEDPETTDIHADDFAWPQPAANTAARIDDMFHAAVNGHGKYLSAADPEELVQALNETVKDIVARAQSPNTVALSSFRLQEDSKIYSSRFQSGSWWGELLAYTINADGTISATPAWNAAEELENNNSRTILTYADYTGEPFLWDSLSDDQQTALIAGDETDGIGEDRLDYLRGEENDAFRDRDSKLGDIVNSSPIYVGAPASPYPDTDPFGTEDDRYFEFWNTYKNRTSVLYVGANDGMLHGFDANTGEEVMAYVPATVFPNLHELTEPDYVHRYFVDQTPSISDAYFNSDWHTVLVGGLGAGGRGLFALDITNPNRFEEANADEIVLWEINSTDDADLGFTLSQPVIGMTEEGRWAAFVGNGYNSDDGQAILFIIYLDADLSDGEWSLGSDYRKISTGTGSADDKNGLSSPAVVDSNGDGYIDRVYAGDLRGNMWAFKISNGVDNWGPAYLNSDSEPQPLYQAKNAAGEVQPITAKPSVIRHPHQPTISNNDVDLNTSPNLMVLFGTGQYLTQSDLTSTQTQTFYGIWDKGQAYDQDDNALSRSNLIGQSITSGTDEGIQARITSNTYVPYGEADNAQRFGWYVDLDTTDASTGERVVSNAVVLRDIVFFNTYTPETTECGTGGSGWFMFLNASNGGYPDEAIISINNDFLIDADDLVSIGDYEDTAPSGLKINTLGSPSLDLSGAVLLHKDTGIERLAADIGLGDLSKRISWRELRQD